MLVSTKGRYALRLAVDVARHEDEGNVSLREVSEREGISLKYLEQLARDLVRAGVFPRRSRQGAGVTPRSRMRRRDGGGTCFRAVEGGHGPVACLELERGGCPRAKGLLDRAFLERARTRSSSHVDGVSLADLAAGDASAFDFGRFASSSI